jgi:hypothetical protein
MLSLTACTEANKILILVAETLIPGSGGAAGTRPETDGVALQQHLIAQYSRCPTLLQGTYNNVMSAGRAWCSRA